MNVAMADVARESGVSLALVSRAMRGRPGVSEATGFARRPPSYNIEDMLMKEIEIRGSYIYAGEFEQAIDLLARKVIDITPLISGVVHLDEAAEAFTAMRTSPDVVKYLIRPTAAPSSAPA